MVANTGKYNDILVRCNILISNMNDYVVGIVQ